MYAPSPKRNQREMYRAKQAGYQAPEQQTHHAQPMMDQYNYSESNRTSVKVHHAPGGNSNWSIGGGGYEQEKPASYLKPTQYQPKPQYDEQQYGMNTQELDQRTQSRAKQQSSYGQKQLSSSYFDDSFGAPGTSQNRKTQSSNKYSSFGNEIQNNTNNQSTIKAPMDQYNFGEYGGKRTSVKVHHAPGGQSNLNVFGEEPSNAPMKFSAGGRRQAGSNTPATEQQSHQVAWASQKAEQYDQNCYGAQVNKIKQDRPQFNFAEHESQNQKRSYSYHENEQRQSQNYQQSSPVKYQGNQSTYYGAPSKGYSNRQESGMNSGPTSGVSSIKLHAPPGGVSTFSLY